VRLPVRVDTAANSAAPAIARTGWLDQQGCFSRVFGPLLQEAGICEGVDGDTQLYLGTRVDAIAVPRPASHARRAQCTVTATDTHSGATVCLLADHVVIAAPPLSEANSCAEKSSFGIVFAPPMPARRDSLFQHAVKMGQYKKVAVVFENDPAKDHFIPPDWPFMLALCHPDGSERGGSPQFWFVENYRALKGDAYRMLVGILCGEDVYRCHGMSDLDVVNILMEQLQQALRDNGCLAPCEVLSQPSSYAVTHWEDQGGAYFFAAAACEEGDLDELAQPLWNNRLFFAGDYSHPEHLGSAHGAYMSGQRVAKEIAMQLQVQRPVKPVAGFT
jgi:hypothetical protein